MPFDRQVAVTGDKTAFLPVFHGVERLKLGVSIAYDESRWKIAVRYFHYPIQ